MSAVAVSVRTCAVTIQMSQQLLADAPCNIFAIIEQQGAVSAAQGRRCWAITTRRRRCRRGWRVIVGERGYCRQHAKSLA